MERERERESFYLTLQRGIGSNESIQSFAIKIKEL
jgi:hypothetical protein